MLLLALSTPAWLLAQDPVAEAVLPEPLSRTRAAELREALIPAETAAWETIPWRTDLLAARREAFEEGKALFLWSMNGHPLGCV